MTLRTLVLTVSLLCSAPRSSWASETTPLTWSEAVAIAEVQAPSVVVAAVQGDLSDAGVAVAGRLSDPVVTVGTTTNSYQALANLFVSLPVFGQTVAAAGAARADAVVSRAGVDVARLDARLAAALAWLDLWQRQREAALAAETLSRRERLLLDAQLRREVGGGSDLDVWRAQSARARAAADASALASEVEATGATLAAVLATGTGTLVATGAPSLGPVAVDGGSLATFIDSHPVVLRGEALLHARHAAVRRERIARIPTLGLELQSSFLPRGAKSQTNGPGLQGTVAVQVPLFSRAVVREALVAERLAQTQLDTLVAALLDRLLSTRASFEGAASRAQLQTDTVLPLAEQTREAAVAAFRAGGLDLTSTLAVEQDLTDAQRATVQATADAARARARLEHAAGRSL